MVEPVRECRLPFACPPWDHARCNAGAEYHAPIGRSVTAFGAILAVFAAGACGGNWPCDTSAATSNGGA